jgi:hypothetical protein
MEFSAPVKVPDGRYYLKVTKDNRILLNNVKADSFVSKPVSISLEEPQAQKVKDMEDVIMTKAKENAVEWFGRDVHVATIQKAFQSSVSLDNKFEVSLSTKKGEVTTAFWGPGKTLMAIDADWSGGSDIIVELSGVWFLKKSFGPIFKILQVKSAVNKRQVEYLFPEEPVEDDEDYLD